MSENIAALLKEFNSSGSKIEQHPQGGEASLGKPGPFGDVEPRKDFVLGEIPPLNGFKEPRCLLQQERYEHRIIAELKASGKTNTEIAHITGYTQPAIGYIVKQPWCKEYILSEIHRRGGQMVQDYMAKHAMPAAETIVQGFMDEDMTRGRDRVAAAEALLNRVFGKPTQTVISHKGSDLSKLTDDELANIAQSGGNGAS